MGSSPRFWDQQHAFRATIATDCMLRCKFAQKHDSRAVIATRIFAVCITRLFLASSGVPHFKAGFALPVCDLHVMYLKTNTCTCTPARFQADFRLSTVWPAVFVMRIAFSASEWKKCATFLGPVFWAQCRFCARAVLFAPPVCDLHVMYVHTSTFCARQSAVSASE